jgi:hypothetical protein
LIEKAIAIKGYTPEEAERRAWEWVYGELRVASGKLEPYELEWCVAGLIEREKIRTEWKTKKHKKKPIILPSQPYNFQNHPDPEPSLRDVDGILDGLVKYWGKEPTADILGIELKSHGLVAPGNSRQQERLGIDLFDAG